MENAAVSCVMMLAKAIATDAMSAVLLHIMAVGSKMGGTMMERLSTSPPVDWLMGMGRCM